MEVRQTVLLLAVAGTCAVWEEGVQIKVAVAADHSYTVVWDGATLPGSWPAGKPTNHTTGSGSDAVGQYKSITFPGSYSIRYYPTYDAFVFRRAVVQQSVGDTVDFPVVKGVPAKQCIGWNAAPMVPGNLYNLTECPTDGPLLLLGASSTLVLGAFDSFTMNFPAVRAGGVVGMSSTAGREGETMSAVLLSRHTISRASRAYGALLRKAWNTTRSRSYGTTRLSYWNDNAAGYNFWQSADKLGRWGRPEDIFLALKKGYDELGVPMAAWEVDSNYAMEVAESTGWCFKDLTAWNTTLYPNGGRLSELLGGLPMTFYIDVFCKDNVHRATGKYKWLDTTWTLHGTGVALAHPDDAYAIYTEVLRVAATQWRQEMLFTDFLSPRGKAVVAAMNNTFGAEARWLGGMTQAAQDLGMEVQYCMASAHQALESLKYPAVTNARANGDGGMAEKDLVYSSLLSGVLGIGWSKDNLRLGGCSNPPCLCPFGHAALQTHLAVLSLGPVGLADQLTGPVGGAKVSVDTNATLAKATSAANGVLLQPSYPLTPLDDLLAHRNGLSPTGGQVWGTYTAIGKYVWWTVLGFTVSPSGTGPPATYTVRGEHLATMVDSPSTNFADIPQGTFVSNPTELTGQHVVWRKSESTARAFNSDGVEVRLESNTADPDVLVVAPVINGVAVLGEVGKVCSISTYRFTDIAPATPSSVSVTLRGTVGEEVHVAYSSSTDRETRTASVTIPSAGTATLHIP